VGLGFIILKNCRDRLDSFYVKSVYFLKGILTFGDLSDSLAILATVLFELIWSNKSVHDAHWNVESTAVIKKVITNTAEIDRRPIVIITNTGI
jgi:hypothetical protein